MGDFGVINDVSQTIVSALGCGTDDPDPARQSGAQLLVWRKCT